MAKYSLQIGVGGIGDDPLLSVQHSVDFHAEDDSSAVAQTMQTIEADNAYMGPERAVLIAEDGSVIWFRPAGG